jgi:mycothiol synthase
LASTDDADAIRIADAAADEDGPLNDVLRADLARPGADSATWVTPDGLAHVQRDARHDASWLLGVAASRPAWPALLERAAAHVADHGGGTVTWWCAGAHDDDLAIATAHGYAVARQQHELRVALPLAPAAESGTGHRRSSEVELRTFESGDIEGVLAVNNAAFAGHHEQGGWTRSTFEARMAQPWFDPSLFVIAATATRVVGFNWLKTHPATANDVARGEIYVIAVDPAAHGRGLGRTLAVRGLDLLHARGFAWGSLFVAADNTAALALYQSLRFATHRTDVALVAHVPAAR